MRIEQDIVSSTPVIRDVLPKLSTRATNVILHSLYHNIHPDHARSMPLAELRRACESGELGRAANCGPVTMLEIRKVLGMPITKVNKRRQKGKGIRLGPHQTDDLLATLSNARDFCCMNGCSLSLRGWLSKCERMIEKARKHG